MLDNLSRSEGMPPPELIRDLRILCGLGADALAGVAEAFKSIPDELTEEAIADAIKEKVRGLKVDPETLTSATRVAVFVLERWERRELQKADIISDLRSIDIGQEQLSNMASLLDAMEQKIAILRHQRIESSTIAVGTPLIDSVLCVVDARAIFKSSKHREDGDDNQPYYQVDHFVPVAILEIVSKINSDKGTHAYLLTESTLNQLYDILGRARKRIVLVRSKFPASTRTSEGQNGSIS
jgi:hypothetical protein